MNLVTIVENVMVKLSGLPGLHFLGRYVSEYHTRRLKVHETAARYKSYVQTVRGAASDVKGSARGSKPEQDIDQDAEEVEEYIEEEDDESYLQ
jgi:hypothetical protein